MVTVEGRFIATPNFVINTFLMRRTCKVVESHTRGNVAAKRLHAVAEAGDLEWRQLRRVTAVAQDALTAEAACKHPAVGGEEQAVTGRTAHLFTVNGIDNSERMS